VDFLPPEVLLENPEYGLPLDVFSYGGVILHVINQEWPKPLHFVTVDPKTKLPFGLTGRKASKVTETSVDLQRLVEECRIPTPCKVFAMTALNNKLIIAGGETREKIC